MSESPGDTKFFSRAEAEVPGRSGSGVREPPRRATEVATLELPEESPRLPNESTRAEEWSGLLNRIHVRSMCERGLPSRKAALRRLTVPPVPCVRSGPPAWAWRRRAPYCSRCYFGPSRLAPGTVQARRVLEGPPASSHRVSRTFGSSWSVAPCCWRRESFSPTSGGPGNKSYPRDPQFTLPSPRCESEAMRVSECGTSG